ncbi:MAG: ferredoxin [Candidatus Diapherotrites archaeon]
MVKVVHKPDDCIGCGACTAICPDFWEMTGDKSKLKGAKKQGDKEVLEVNNAGCNQDAADSCPVPCIFIE